MVKADIEDLKLAWARMKSGRPSRAFISHPFVVRMVEQDLDTWLNSIKVELENGYEPSTCVICQVPKPNNLVRPAAFLTVKDELVYNYLIGSFYSNIVDRIYRHQGITDIAYQVNKNPDSINWVKSDFQIWSQWREESIKKLDKKSGFVVFTDITGYYENIEISILISDIRNLCGKSNELNLLSKMLNLWAHPRQKGIPQGFFASDIIAKLYLTTIDENLLNQGYNFLRYVDDYRFFVEDELTAKQLIKRLSHLIHQRGLNLQSGKTETLEEKVARNKIDGISNTIEEIQNDLKSSIVSEAESFSSNDLFDMLSAAGDVAPRVLEKTFEDFFLGKKEKFNKTLFHYLLVRLGKIKSRIAAKYSLKQIDERPEETQFILRYYSAIGTDEAILSHICDYLNSARAIYDYQVYSILYWAFQSEIEYDGFVLICRTLAFDLRKDYWLRSYAIAYLGKYGQPGDLELIEQHYPKATTEIEKSDCINSLVRMETARRNTFYNRVKNQSFLVQKAVELNK